MEHESMVHALNEIHRILKPGGTLIDLRPLENSWAVEVVDSTGWQAIGRLKDQEIGLADDEAANQAMKTAQANGWFSQSKNTEFPFFYYWDTPSDMKNFIETEWELYEKMDDSLFKQTSAVWASANADARVRVRVKMWIAAWKKI